MDFHRDFLFKINLDSNFIGINIAIFSYSGLRTAKIN